MYFYSLNLVLERSQTRSVDQKDALPPPGHSTDTIVPSQFPIIHSFHCYWGKDRSGLLQRNNSFLVSYVLCLFLINFFNFFSHSFIFPLLSIHSPPVISFPCEIYISIYINFFELGPSVKLPPGNGNTYYTLFRHPLSVGTELYHWREPVTSFTYCHPSPASPPKPNLTLSFPRTLSPLLSFHCSIALLLFHLYSFFPPPPLIRFFLPTIALTIFSSSSHSLSFLFPFAFASSVYSHRAIIIRLLVG